jgi:hypothetical protein
LSDKYISLVSEKLSSANSKKTAEKIVQFLSEQKIIEKKLTDCVLGSPNGHAPDKNYRNALKNPELDLTKLKTNGVQFITEKQVFDNGGNGLEEIKCPNCGENNIENDWGDSLDNWYSGTDSDKINSKNAEMKIQLRNLNLNRLGLLGISESHFGIGQSSTQSLLLNWKK